MKRETRDSSLTRRLVGPKPAVLVTCIDRNGKVNIITIAACTTVSHEPAIYVVAVRHDRYSHDLIAEGKEFVINIPTVDLVEETEFCGTRSGRDLDKFAETGLTAVPASLVNPPLIGECPINIECKVIHSTRQGTHTVFFGEAISAHVREDLFPEGFADYSKLPVILSSFTEYLKVGDLVRSRGER
ncbi:flavin reductase family protein [Candidatus Bathyarchaeota archaeon]|nr:flavin reductase family protein [Candidatus Bathyarchaeota archaeon]